MFSMVQVNSITRQLYCVSKVDKVAEFFPDRLENNVEEGRMLVTSIFSFSQIAFKRLLFKGH